MGKVAVWCIICAGILVIAVTWCVRRSRLPQNPAPAGKDRFIAIVLLLKQPQEVSRDQFVSACERAFGSRPDADQFVDAPPPGKFLVRRGGSAIVLMGVDGSYADDPAATVERLRLFELKQVMGQHRAWMSVDLLGELPPGGREEAYRWTAAIAADLISQNCIGIYSVETQELNVVRPDTVELLRSASPLKAFEYRNPDTSVLIEQDDGELEAAMAEAKRRWPEFVSAFSRKRPMQGFAVKVPFATTHGGLEHTWVEVERLDSGTIWGKLANEPHDIANRRIGDAVTVKVDDVEDWIYQEGAGMVGGFTSKILATRQKGH